MYPQVKAFGIAIHHDRLLVQEYHTSDETYYRPLGGSIELGEKSAHTVIREFKEEPSYRSGNHQLFRLLRKHFSS